MFRYFESSQMLSQGFLLAMNADGEINEIDRTCRKVSVTNGIPEVTSWFNAWAELGDLLTRQAGDDLKRNRRVSAAHKLRRTSVYFGLCERYIPHTDPRKAQCYARMQFAFRQYIELLREPCEFVEVPYENGKSLPALFIPAATPGPAPTIIFIDGFDLYKELVHLRKNGDAARLRNMAMLIVDTPGVGEALRLRGLTTRYDTEVPVRYCFDYLAKRNDVDLDHVGLIGLSLGGYYAPRAAAFEPRIQAVVAISGPYDFGETWEQLPPLTREAFAVKSGATDEPDARRRAHELSLKGVAEWVTQPALYVTGALDRIVPWRQTERAARESPNGSFVCYEDGSHVCSNVPYRYRPLVGDWMAGQLAPAR